MIILLIAALVTTWFPGQLQIKVDENQVSIFVGGGIQKVVYQSSQNRK